MHLDRIAELLEPFTGKLDTQRPETKNLLTNISTYIDILLYWNARINLTAIRDPEKIVTRHFGESLFVARHLFPEPYPVPTVSSGVESVGIPTIPTLADVGSGAGFPGIPIKLWNAGLALTLIESNHKKAAFLREVCRALRLTDIDIQNTRAEILVPATFDVVTLRAVEHFEHVLPIAAKLLTPAGRLAVLISSSQANAAKRTLTDFSWASEAPVPNSHSRVLVITTKPNQNHES